MDFLTTFYNVALVLLYAIPGFILVKVNAKKTVINNSYEAPMKTAIKNVRKFIAKKDKDEAKKALKVAFKAIDKACDNGIIKENTRARYKSRLTKAVNKM